MTRARVVVRTAMPSEREAVIGLIQELNEHEAEVSGDRRRGRAAAEAYYPVFLERLAKAEGRLLVADVEGEVAGMMGFVVQTEDVYVEERLRRHGHVTELVVAREWRGLGVGRIMLEEAERLARALRLPRMSIGVLVGNDGAERLYRARGYEPYMTMLMKPLD